MECSAEEFIKYIESGNYYVSDFFRSKSKYAYNEVGLGRRFIKSTKENRREVFLHFIKNKEDLEHWTEEYWEYTIALSNIFIEEYGLPSLETQRAMLWYFELRDEWFTKKSSALKFFSHFSPEVWDFEIVTHIYNCHEYKFPQILDVLIEVGIDLELIYKVILQYPDCEEQIKILESNGLDMSSVQFELNKVKFFTPDSEIFNGVQAMNEDDYTIDILYIPTCNSHYLLNCMDPENIFEKIHDDNLKIYVNMINKFVEAGLEFDRIVKLVNKN